MLYCDNREVTSYNLPLELVSKNVTRLTFDYQIAVNRIGIWLNKSKYGKHQFVSYTYQEPKKIINIIIIIVFKLKMKNQYF